MSQLIKKAVVIGATGLVGKSLVFALNALSTCEHILLIVRREHADFTNLEKVQQLVLPNLDEMTADQVQDFSHAFSCLGTTIKKAGSKTAFYKIDFELNAHFAKLIAEHGTHFVLVSAMGANRKSPFFYNRVKGELEDYLQTLAFEKLSIVRPSLLLGEREESRLLEDISQSIFRKISHLVPQTFAHKPVTAEKVAHTMVVVAQTQTVNFEIYDNLYIQQTK